MRDTREVKANGLQGEAPPAMIETIADADDPFDDRGAAATIADAGGKRWVRPVDHTFAAYVFSEPSRYSAQIVGDDGAVLATWPSS